MPETIRSGRSPTSPRCAKRTQSTGVPSVANPVLPSRSSTSATFSERWMVMPRAEPERFESGAITWTSPNRWSACFAWNRPREVMPSSLVRRMFTAETSYACHPTRGDTMPTVVAYHDVKDTDHWLASPKREEFFGPLGVTNIRTFVDPQNRKRVGLLMDIPDMDAVMVAMETDAAAEAMAHDGVVP